MDGPLEYPDKLKNPSRGRFLIASRSGKDRSVKSVCSMNLRVALQCVTILAILLHVF
jgi:hypothetical protein